MTSSFKPLPTCASCDAEGLIRRFLEVRPAEALSLGWARWSAQDGRSLWVCPVCWLAGDYPVLVGRLGGAPQRVLAHHPGCLPSDQERVCVPLNGFEVGEDGWRTNVELLQLKEAVASGALRRQAAAAARARATAAAPAPTSPPRGRTMSSIAHAYPGVRVERELGTGAFSSVYAVVRDDGERLALKILAPACFREPTLRERFSREIEVLQELDHPNIVRLVEARALTGQHCFLMELVEGGDSLRELLAYSRPRTREALRICADIADGLEHAHARGVVHRDIKPENLLLDASRQVKILDFGIAKLVTPQDENQLTLTMDVMGTGSYMAPEVLISAKAASPASDIFSLGVVLYELLAKEHLKRGRRIGPKSEKLAALPPELAAIVAKACEPFVERRFSSAAAMRDTLREAAKAYGTPSSGR